MVKDDKIVIRRLVDFRPFAGAAQSLVADPQVWIETRDLLADLVRNAREPIPEAVLAHLRARLDGTARKKQGRARQRNARFLRKLLMSARFERIEAWLNARQERHGLEGWSFIRNADWWQGPPSERAARMVRHRLAPTIGWERVRNIAYEIAPRTMPGTRGKASREIS